MLMAGLYPSYARRLRVHLEAHTTRSLPIRLLTGIWAEAVLAVVCAEPEERMDCVVINV